MSNHKEVNAAAAPLSSLYYHPGCDKYAGLKRSFSWLPGVQLPQANIIRDPAPGETTHDLFRKGFHPLSEGQSLPRQLNFSDQDLSNADLNSVRFNQAIMKGCNLSGSRLSQASLKNCNLENALLSNCDLSNADLSGANLQNATLINCRIQGANFNNADLSGASLEGILFDQSNDLSGCQLTHAKLRDGGFYSADLTQLKLSDSQLQEVVIQECKLSSTLFERAGLRHVLIDNCHDEADKGGFTSFRGTTVEQTTFRNCTFLRADFFSAELSDCLFENIHFIYCLFMTAKLKQSTFGLCRFSEMNNHRDKGCDFFNTVFDDCRIESCDFTGARTSNIVQKNMRRKAVSETKKFPSLQNEEITPVTGS
ncbi:pentapeptide repeat-containing protein [Spongorhabdus nitratireducens]